MRYAILSDVHGNLEALRAVLADAAAEGAHALIALGDTIGYGADPAACLESVAARAAAIVTGNHEAGAAGTLGLNWFNPAARQALAWTRRQLGDDHRRWLADLPLATTLGEATLVHASPEHPEEWDYLVSAAEGFAVFGAFASRLCFVGHSHRPTLWSVGSSGPKFTGRFRAWPLEVHLQTGRRYLINVGSVGQPRDRDPRASYAVWDEEARLVRIRRVPYDVLAAADKIRAAGLPLLLAERLADGL
jgi:diadenosine tetraphosphatase ApaH/serine/threonine PP2A family protein phosphatase